MNHFPICMIKKKTNENKQPKTFGFLTIFTLCLLLFILLASHTNLLVKLDVCAPTYQLQVEKTIEQISNGHMISLLYDMDEDEIHYIVQKVFDQPEFFWIGHTYSRMSYGNLTVVFFKKYDKDPDVIEKKQKEIDDVVDAVINERLSANMTDYQKALVIYDWLIQNTTYEIIDNENDQTMYNAIVQKKSVCTGYAHALTYMFNKVGIQAETRCGYSLNADGTRDEKHRWTVAYINGEPCYFDPTWDDKDDGASRFDYFGLPANLFKKSHETIPLEPWKESVSVSTDYYRNSGRYFDQFSEQSLIDMTLETIDNDNIARFRYNGNPAIENAIRTTISKPEFINTINQATGKQYVSLQYVINQANVVEMIFSESLPS